MHGGRAGTTVRAVLHRLAVSDLDNQLGLIIADNVHDTETAQVQPHGHGILGDEAPS
jgi:hypothetical protein